MSKKLLALISALLVLAAILAACGGSPPAPAASDSGTAATTAPAAAPADEKVTLKVLVHQNPPMVEFMNAFNEKFQAKYPNITVDMSVVNANDLSTVTQTRLTANDVDVIDMFGFANPVAAVHEERHPPNWQQLIDAGLLMPTSRTRRSSRTTTRSRSRTPASYKGKVYGVNLGRVSTAASTTTRTCFAATTSSSRPPGASSSPRATPSRREHPVHDRRRQGRLARLRRRLRPRRRQLPRPGGARRGLWTGSHEVERPL
jgi:raffinose/stachyose/melibiose transport system substrate-binding protein